jgi:hypothetical protein
VDTEPSTAATETAPIEEQCNVQYKNEASDNGATTEVMTEMDTEQLTEVEVLQITGRRLRKPPIGRKNPRKTSRDWKYSEACNGDHNVIDPNVQMPRLQEACITAPTSCGLMPVSALFNGALLIPSGDLFYALQSPRDKRAGCLPYS